MVGNGRLLLFFFVACWHSKYKYTQNSTNKTSFIQNKKLFHPLITTSIVISHKFTNMYVSDN